MASGSIGLCLGGCPRAAACVTRAHAHECVSRAHAHECVLHFSVVCAVTVALQKAGEDTQSVPTVSNSPYSGSQCRALNWQWRMASFSPLSCMRGSQRTNAHRTFEDIKVGCALRPSRRLSSVAARRASPLDSALRVDLETTLGHRQLHPDASHMRRVSPPRVSLYSMLGCELKKNRSAPAASSSTHAVLAPLGSWPEDDSQCKIGKTSRGAV